MKTLKVEGLYPMAYKPSPMSPTTFRDSSTRSTTATVSAFSARNTSRTATPGKRSNRQPDPCLVPGLTPLSHNSALPNELRAIAQKGRLTLV